MEIIVIKIFKKAFCEIPNFKPPTQKNDEGNNTLFFLFAEIYFIYKSNCHLIKNLEERGKIIEKILSKKQVIKIKIFHYFIIENLIKHHNP